MDRLRQIVADALLAGDDIRLAMRAAGVPEENVDKLASQAANDPIVQAAQRLQRRVAKRDWTLGIQRRLAGDLAIPRRSDIDPQQFYDEFYAANRPVMLTGLIDHWPALRLWDLDYLAMRVGDAEVEVQVGRDSSASYERDKDAHKRTIPFRKLITAMRQVDSSNDFYLTAYNSMRNVQALAPLWDDTGSITLLETSGDNDGFFWLGPKGTLTPFHHDLTNNLLVQVMGRKTCQLVPSWEVGRMRNGQHCFSDLSLEDFEANDPTLPQVLTCTIGPGEALFLPIGWWHHVEALDHSISMTFTNFRADNGFYKDYPADTRF